MKINRYDKKVIIINWKKTDTDKIDIDIMNNHIYMRNTKISIIIIIIITSDNNS